MPDVTSKKWIDNLQGCIAEVDDEITRAVDRFPEFASPHEGYAVILEELDELWEEVKKQHDVRGNQRMRAEAKQVAAMALRFMTDCTTEE